MAATWVARGGVDARVYVRVAYVISLVIEESTIYGTYPVRATMISGSEYFLYFDSEESRAEFVSQWAGETEELDMEPAVKPMEVS